MTPPLVTPPPGDLVTDVDRELARVDLALSTASAEPRPRTPDVVTRVVHLQLHRAGLTGRQEDLDRAVRAVGTAFDALGPWPDLCLLQADLDVRFHRLAAARHALGRAGGVRECPQGRAVLADILVQEGEIDVAETLVTDLVEEERTWDHLARLAHLASCRGELDRADALLVEAEDEITAKSMRSFAWVEIERGRLRALDGDRAQARAHYARAEDAYTGHWMVDQRVGELCALEGRPAAAVDHLERVLERTGKPEVSQALSPLYAALGNQAEADRHHDRAMTVFLASAQAGDAHYLHHLVDLCLAPADRPCDPAAAVHWARRDLSLRPNHLTRGALAVALEREGRSSEAVEEMTRALASGLRDPRLLTRAAEVFGSDEAAWPALG